MWCRDSSYPFPSNRNRNEIWWRNDRIANRNLHIPIERRRMEWERVVGGCSLWNTVEPFWREKDYGRNTGKGRGRKKWTDREASLKVWAWLSQVMTISLYFLPPSHPPPPSPPFPSLLPFSFRFSWISIVIEWRLFVVSIELMYTLWRGRTSHWRISPFQEGTDAIGNDYTQVNTNWSFTYSYNTETIYKLYRS